MAVWTEIMGRYDGEETSWTALVGAGYTSPYTPKANCRLRKLSIVQAAGAATTLIDAVVFRLTHAGFRPVNSLEVGYYGGGVQTNANHKMNQGIAAEWEVDQQLQAGVPVVIEAKNISAQTAVTVDVLLIGTFEG